MLANEHKSSFINFPFCLNSLGIFSNDLFALYSLRHAKITFAPDFTISIAVYSPNPDEAPVIIMNLPLRSELSVLYPN